MFLFTKNFAERLIFIYILGIATFVVILLFLYFPIKKSIPITIWSWERSENLDFLDRNIQVAFYAGTIYLKKDGVEFNPRYNSLLMNDETKAIAVFRVENRENNLGEKHLDQVIEKIILAFNRLRDRDEKIIGLQIDFDAKLSERNLYKIMLARIRELLPSSTFLSITALISWCHKNSWLEELAVDEVVPLFYGLSWQDRYYLQNDLYNKSFMKSHACNSAIGLSFDESLPPSRYIKNKKIYIFKNEPWQKDDIEKFLAKIYNFK
ncbi:MAG: hypothetical protein NZ822_01555 [Patescibacteria group bacterium]|nr:hypothetical protein [Patescibacteria group bacterium]